MQPRDPLPTGALVKIGGKVGVVESSGPKRTAIRFLVTDDEGALSKDYLCGPCHVAPKLKYYPTQDRVYRVYTPQEAKNLVSQMYARNAVEPLEEGSLILVDDRPGFVVTSQPRHTWIRFLVKDIDQGEPQKSPVGIYFMETAPEVFHSEDLKDCEVLAPEHAKHFISAYLEQPERKVTFLPDTTGVYCVNCKSHKVSHEPDGDCPYPGFATPAEKKKGFVFEPDYLNLQMVDPTFAIFKVAPNLDYRTTFDQPLPSLDLLVAQLVVQDFVEVLIDALDCNLGQIANACNTEVSHYLKLREDWPFQWLEDIHVLLYHSWDRAEVKLPIRLCPHGSGLYTPSPDHVECFAQGVPLAPPTYNREIDDLCPQCLQERADKLRVLCKEFRALEMQMT